MRRGVWHREISFLLALCLLFTQLFLVVPSRATAAVTVNTDNVATTADLFTEKTTINGQYYEIYRIPGIVVTYDGTLIAYCEARKTTSDWADIDILMVRSTDGGQTWSAPVKIVDGVSTQNTMNNPVMIAERDSNTVHLLYSKEYAQTFHLKSTDGGLTWTNPSNAQSTAPTDITAAFRESTYQWRVIAVGPGHGIQLDSGRLIASVWMANGGESAPTGHAPSVVSTIYSDDHGDTWHIGDIVAADSPELSNPNESTLVQLANGSVMINMRNNDSGNRRAVSISPDGISNWSTPVFDEELIDPLCFGSIVRYSEAGEAGEAGDKNRILFVNANSETARENLTLRMSEDEGETWTYSRMLQLGGAAYSDIAVGQDKSIYVFYEREPYKFLTVKKLGLNWLTSPPPTAQLNNISIAGADLAPSFLSEVYSYDVRVDANITSMMITPTAFPNSGSTITINGQPATSGQPFSVPISGETAEINVIVTNGGQSNTYKLKAAKKRLVTNWRFEKSPSGSVYDSSGYGNSAVNAFRGIEYEQGYIGKALKFDDSPTGATIQDKELLDVTGIDATKFGTGDFSVSSWVYVDHGLLTSGQQNMLFWYGRNASDISQFWVRTKQASSGKANLEFSTGNKPNGTGSEVNASTSDAPIRAGAWQHIVTQRKKGVMEIYVDGVRKVRKGSTPLDVSRGPETNLFIGRAKSGDRGWKGKMDEIRMYNYGLSQSEISVLAGRAAVNTTELEGKIAESKSLVESEYPAQSWANLQSALAAAEALLDSDGISQSGVNQAKSNLQDMILVLVPGYQVTATASPVEGGSVTGGGGYAATGDSVTVSAIANANYRFVNWTAGGSEVSTNPTYTFTMGSQAVKLVANYEITISHTVSVSPTIGGTVVGGGVYLQGASVTVNATADAGYKFVGWTRNGTTVSDTQEYTFTLGTEDVHLVAKFEQIGLIGNYKFEHSGSNSVYDSSAAASVTAVIYGASYAPGYIGQSLQFNNATDFVDITGADEGIRFGTGDFTVTTWVYANQLNGDRFLFWYGANSNPVSQWWARTSGDAVQLNTGFSGAETTMWTPSSTLRTNQWTHLAFQRKQDKLYIYVNGVEKANKVSTPFNVSNGNHILRIGKAGSGANRPWNGKMDEIRLYNYGLSVSDIQELASRQPANTTDLVSKIGEAKAHNATTYTPLSWAALQAALTAAEVELDSDAITQAGIDRVKAAVQAAIAGLVIASTDGEDEGSQQPTELPPVIITDPSLQTKDSLTTAAETLVKLGNEAAASDAVHQAAQLINETAQAIEAIQDPAAAVSKTVEIIKSASTIIKSAEAAGIDINAIAHALLNAANKAIQKTAVTVVTSVVTDHKSSLVVEDSIVADLAAKLGIIKQTVKEINQELAAAHADVKVPSVLEMKAAAGANVTEVEAKLPTGLIAKAEELAIDRIAIDTGVAKIAFAPEIFRSAGHEAVSLAVKKLDADRLSEAIKSVVDGNTVYDFTAAIGDKKLSAFSTPVEITLPYTLKPGEKPDQITVFFINDNGDLENMAGNYDEATGTVYFTTSHFSYYAVKMNAKSFGDIDGSVWAKSAIEAMAAKGIIVGTSEAAYQPSGHVTRAQFAALLVRELKLMDSGAVSSFQDVKSSDWFYKEVSSAVQAGLIEGRGDGTFDPDAYISRQDMSVMIGRVLVNQLGKASSATGKYLETFQDAAQISEYARRFADLSVKYRLLQGVDDVTFAPRSLSTRAEAAVILSRLLDIQ
ncbi:hypothetical protein ASG89_14745 [Paenibacillus sp. Soil766]|uniref:LamG-like jellyroll fold domain-containing protein n=1 Tax=Paenibacillus sp. Soil766 TaxID=1736404 RepID=UPI0007107F00|nr:LamG-like jellyroll fold domain-containing protein [Paenibacillus sp. Soil766]KRE82511.1 hypothetical protein ASG89_14745 [Paenibacillus sp. Soil766]